MTTVADTERLIAIAEAALERLVPNSSKLLLAVSGGSDSIGLMWLANCVAAKSEIELVVGFIDHRLRQDVEAEWALVSNQALSLGLHVERAAPSPEEVTRAREVASLQQWAREVRYRELAKIARRVGAKFVATGHTLDDQAETVLLRLIRGTGIDGLAGIPPLREIEPGVEVVRPLLGIHRLEIRALLEREGISWIDDPSNADTRFLRVRIRDELLPIMDSLQPGVSKRLVALAGEARGASQFLEQYLEDETYCKNIRLLDGVKVDSQVFSALPDSTWTRLIRLALRRVRGDLRGVERAHIHPIEELVRTGGSGGPLPVPGQAQAYVCAGSLFVFPRPLLGRPTGAGQPVAAGAGLWNARFAALGAIAEINTISPELVVDLEVRARLPGDRLLGSERKLKEVLSEHRVPGPYRDYVPVLAAGDQVVACPSLIRCRRDGIEVRWLLDDGAPFLDVDFPST